MDLADAVDLLHINKDSLDRAYLTSRAARKGLEKDLHAALEKAQA